MYGEFRLLQEEVAHIQELEQELIALEPKVLAILDNLPDSQRQLLEGYFFSLRELQMLQVQYAYRRGRQAKPGAQPKK